VPQLKKRSQAISLIVSRVAFKIEVRQKAAGKRTVSLGQHAAMVERLALLRATFKTSTTTAGSKEMCRV
jgi:hypothetical protein